MTRDELYRKSLSNPQYLDFYLHSKYDEYIQKEYIRIVGKDFYQGITDAVLSTVHIRLPEISMDCDIRVLVFDCLRKEILRKARREGDFDCAQNCSVMKDTTLSITDEVPSQLLEIVLPLLSKKQLRYFLDKYYYFKDVKVNKRYERLFSQLFRGKGIASARFEYYKVIPNKTEAIPYALYLEYLDFRKIEFLSDGSIIFLTDTLLGTPILYKLWERQYRISKYTIIVLVILALFVCVSLLISFLAI